MSGATASSLTTPVKQSAKRSITLICQILRRTLRLNEQVIQPEYIRRCKQNQLTSTNDTNEDDRTGERIQEGLWHAIHHTILLELHQPVQSSTHSTRSGSSFSLTQLEEYWLQRGSEEELVTFLVEQLHQWNYHGLCQKDAHASQHTVPPPVIITCRQQLLALGWLIARTKLIHRYVEMIEAESRLAWFVPSYHRAGVRLQPDRTAHPLIPIPTSQTARTSTSSFHSRQNGQASQPQFPQPLIPSSLTDSAGSFTHDGYLDQNQEYRLLHQLIEEEEFIEPEEPTVKSRVGSTGATTQSLHRHPMCLPTPNESTQIAFSDSLAAALSSSHSNQSMTPRALHARLNHRLHQCISTHGKIEIGLKKMEQMTQQQTDLIAKLQFLQRHPSVRNHGGTPFTPFELQLLKSPSFQASVLQNLSEWLDQVSDYSNTNALIPINTHEFESALRTWWQWMESVAQLEAQEAAAEAAATADTNRASSHLKASSTIHSSRHSSGSTSHRSIVRGSTTRRSLGEASLSPTKSPPGLTASTRPSNSPHPSHTIWCALNHRSDRDLDDDEFTNESAASLLRNHLHQPVGTLRMPNSHTQSFTSSIQSQTASSTTVSDSVSGPTLIRWSDVDSADQLDQLTPSEMDLNELRVDHSALIEQAMSIGAKGEGARFGHQEGDFFPFTIHT